MDFIASSQSYVMLCGSLEHFVLLPLAHICAILTSLIPKQQRADTTAVDLIISFQL